MLMESKSSFIICLVTFLNFSSLRFIQGMDNQNYYNPVSLDHFFQDYAQNSLSKRHHTGTLHNISLPANFSGMDVSITRVRSASFWARGVNFSYFNIPPRIIPQPFVRRLDIVYSNLGNWSSHYYNVPNYTFATPVLGFMTYAARNSRNKKNQTSTTRLGITLIGNPIVVRFSRVSDLKMRCVMFRTNGTIEMSDVIIERDDAMCIVWDQGHFSIIVPVVPVPPVAKKREELWRWWGIGFGVGVVGLLLVGLVVFIVIRLVRVKKIGKMEKQSEKNEALDTTWVGNSRMPSASGVRTQPILENDYFP